MKGKSGSAAALLQVGVAGLRGSEPAPLADGVAADGSPTLLREAFGEFIAASARLEMSYRELQGEVQLLGRELEQRNLALGVSLEENRAMRESLEQILDAMPCGVLVVDGEGEIRMGNPEAARLLLMEEKRMRSIREVRSERGSTWGWTRRLAPRTAWSRSWRCAGRRASAGWRCGGEFWMTRDRSARTTLGGRW